MIYLDNAATSWPKPEAVYATLGSFLREAGANPGRSSHRMAASAAQTVMETRQGLARLINACAVERVVFAANATDALNQAISGLLRPGDRVITTSMEHNSVRRPLHTSRLQGVEVITVAAGRTGVVDPIRIGEVIKGATLVAITHASNVNGAMQPVGEIARLAHAAGALVLVDASQTVGALQLDVQDLDIDLVAFPGHKALLGPPGTGALFIGERVDLVAFSPLRSGGTGVDSQEPAQPSTLPHRYEAGTLNTIGIAALGAGLAAVASRGMVEVERHHLQLTHLLLDGLAEIPNVSLYRTCQARQAAVVSFNIDGWLPAEAGSILDQSFDIACRTGLHCAPDACVAIGAPAQGTIRFSPGFFSTASEMIEAVSAVRELAQSPISA